MVGWLDFPKSDGIATWDEECDENVAFPLHNPLGKSRGGGNLNADSFKTKKIPQLIAMKKTIIAVALVAGLSSFAGNAKAASTYNWSFTNQYIIGSGWGLTSLGTITGTVDQGGAFTPVSATYSSGNNTGSFDFLNNVRFQANSLFALNDGTLSGGVKYLYNDNRSFQLNYSSMMGGIVSAVDTGAASYVANYSSRANIVAEVVPEPSTYALFGLGALALVVAYRRKIA